jgi:O-antigen/teichoic acid export membrane protein
MVASRFVAFIALVGLARSVTKDDLGYLLGGLAILALAGVVVDFGTMDWTVRQGPEGDDLRRVLGVRLTMALLGSLLVAGSGLLIFGVDQWQAVASISIALPAVAVITNSATSLRLADRPTVAAAMNALPAIVPYLAALAVAWFTTSLLAGATGGLVVASVLVAKQGGWRPPSGLRHVRRVGRASGPFAVTSMCVAVYSRIDRLVLAVLAGTAAAAVYTASYSIVFGVSLLGPALGWVALPALSSAPTDEEWVRQFRSRFRFASVAGVVLGSGFAAAAPWAIPHIFGAGYGPGPVALASFALLCCLYVVNPLLASALQSRRREGVVAVVSAVSAVGAIVLYPVAAAWGGIGGVAALSAAAEVGGCAVLGAYVWTRLWPPRLAEEQRGRVRSAA